VQGLGVSTNVARDGDMNVGSGWRRSVDQEIHHACRGFGS
jgi:hypothetical protein